MTVLSKIRALLRRKPQPQPDFTIEDILAESDISEASDNIHIDINKMVARFMSGEARDCTGTIIVFVKGDFAGLLYCGLTYMEALGALAIAHSQITSQLKDGEDDGDANTI